MLINIKENEMIKEQSLDISNDVSIIYGYNNCGKTTILKSINKALTNKIKEKYFSDDSIMHTYIPTNRVVISNSKVILPTILDVEDFINYEEDIYTGYDEHLKILRSHLLKVKTINNYIFKAVKELFCIELPRNKDSFIEDIKYSDGIENIINIYLNIIWVLTWNINVRKLTYGKLKETLSNGQAYILIDEIEMFLHVNIQSKLINALKRNFSKCGFILTTHSPLLLTRYAGAKIYNIETGQLKSLNQKLFYEDLNRIFQVYFNVDELPKNVEKYLNYLGDVITRKVSIDKKKIEHIENVFEEEYPSLYKKYNAMIAKAKFIGDNNV